MDILELMAAVLRSTQQTVIGRLGSDPEIQYFNSGTCKTKLSLAVNRPGQKKNDPNALPPDWFKAELWGEDAEGAANELRKGDLVKVTGRVSTDRWTDRSGMERTDLLIRVEEWAPVVTGNTAPTAAPAAPAAAATPAITPTVVF
jgi:single-strand DNA-binding protein